MPGPIPWIDVFRQRLRDLGWVEGENAVIEQRYAEGSPERFPDLAADLVRLKVDVFVTAGNNATVAARDATGSVPVVFVATDPVGRGWAASLARPGGRLTGIDSQSDLLNSKMLEVLRDAFPRLRRVGVFYQSTPTLRRALKEVESAARGLSIQIVPVEVGSADDIDRTAAPLAAKRVDAILPLSNPFFDAERARLVSLATKLRVPAVYEHRAFVEAGGLMSYGVDLGEVFRRMAAYVDKILRGTRPADLPIERPTKFELVINLQTAKALGLTIPQSLLIRADEVIQ
jgi:putative ABC transport system substrate-binding protein